MRPPLTIVFSRQITDSTYTLVAHLDWDVVTKWSAPEVLKWMLALIAQMGTARQTVMDSLSVDWLDVYVGAVQRAQRPPKAIVYSEITLGLMEEFVREGTTLGRSTTSCEITNGTLEVLLREYDVTGAPVFCDCIEYYSCTVHSRLETCLILYPEVMRWARFGPDQALPFSTSISYLNPFPLTSDRYVAETVLNRPTANMVSGELDTRVRNTLG
ncbi:hypothetical protein Tcan_02793 [Toxocara canis]|uniref:Uncharacterized protein n=1 Tax=Toxocara canis TaxID=6265 RepID=A0A0B2VA81_TOXCA|nr:hypothetical protein Tcan_02793 [Toxocara canis]